VSTQGKAGDGRSKVRSTNSLESNRPEMTEPRSLADELRVSINMDSGFLLVDERGGDVLSFNGPVPGCQQEERKK
jgi:hypothetical protein